MAIVTLVIFIWKPKVMEGIKRQIRRRKLKCINCESESHLYKECPEPVTSYGVIAIRNGNHSMSGLLESPDIYTCGVHSNAHSGNTVLPMNIINPEGKVKMYFMVQRRDTMGYVDFVRGRGNTPEQILKNVSEMTCSERRRIEIMDFDELWRNVWMNRDIPIYRKDKEDARLKFSKYDIPHLLKSSKCSWVTPEFGFPKGKKNIWESKFQCAIREFFEESGYSNRDNIKINKDPTWSEVYTGTDGIRYKHVYFTANVPDNSILNTSIDKNNVLQAGEISNCGWFTYEQCVDLIRPYNQEKKDVLTRVHRFYEKQT